MWKENDLKLKLVWVQTPTHKTVSLCSSLCTLVFWEEEGGYVHINFCLYIKRYHVRALGLLLSSIDLYARLVSCGVWRLCGQKQGEREIYARGSNLMIVSGAT